MLKRIIVPAGLSLSLGLIVGGGGCQPRDFPAQAAETKSDESETPAAALVTTDTLEYCNRLAQELAGARSPPRAAIELTEEGEHLCQTGQIRGGILRLRRASVLLHGTAQH